MNLFEELAEMSAAQCGVDLKRMQREMKYENYENGCELRYLRCKGECKCKEVVTKTEHRYLDK